MHRHLAVLVDVMIDTLRVLEVLDHDFAALQTRVSESKLENLDVLDLRDTVSFARNRDLLRAHLAIQSVVLDGEETLSERDLQLLDENILRVVDADEELNDVAALALPEF